MIVFYLILFFGGEPLLLPEAYGSMELCEAAALDARENFTGEAQVEFTCVPAQPRRDA